ncbi:MAG: hypothetical protein FWG50_08745, partial [Kiritimatiellaeota bacterium]|nr:hypothetical protein [Kiritimatiellota bacterium]
MRFFHDMIARALRPKGNVVFGLLAICTAVWLAGCGRAKAPPQTPGALRLVSTAPNLTEVAVAVGAGGC